jgi:hypothetical protein
VPGGRTVDARPSSLSRGGRRRFDALSYLPARLPLPLPSPQVGLERVLLRNTGPGKAPLQLGATAAAATPAGDLLVGGGDGALALLRTAREPSAANPKRLRPMAAVAAGRVEGGVSSVVIEGPRGGGGGGFSALVGTRASNVYRVTFDALANKCAGGRAAGPVSSPVLLGLQGAGRGAGPVAPLRCAARGGSGLGCGPGCASSRRAPPNHWPQPALPGESSAAAAAGPARTLAQHAHPLPYRKGRHPEDPPLLPTSKGKPSRHARHAGCPRSC